MSIRFQFNDREFKAAVMKATAKGLQQCGSYLQAKCKQAVSKANPAHRRVRFSAAQSARRRGQRSGKIYSNMENLYAGQPPFARTGFLRSSIVMESNDNPFAPAIRVGVTKAAMYGAFLDLGTRRIRPRPWLLETFEKYRPELIRILELAAKGR